MIPRLIERDGAAEFPIAGNWYGTTIRVYDPTILAWANLLDRSAKKCFPSADRTGSRGRNRSGGHDRNRGAYALELHRDHGQFLPLAGRKQTCRSTGVASARGSARATSSILSLRPHHSIQQGQKRLMQIRSIRPCGTPELADRPAECRRCRFRRSRSSNRCESGSCCRLALQSARA
jgi:hypothetical protein